MSKRYKIGIDLGGTKTKMALVDTRGKVSYRREIYTPLDVKRSIIIDALVRNVKGIISQAGVANKDIAGVGIGVPGPVDLPKGVVHYFPNIKGWDNVALRAILQKKLKLRVQLDNDVNAMTLGEYVFGAGKGTNNLVCLTLGTGVGGGLIINGKLFRGSTMVAGEIGHMPVNEIGPKCGCRSYACLESYIGNRYIINRARKIFGKRITLEQLTSIARGGDKKAMGIWTDVGKKLGVVLAGVVNLLNPDMIVIGGGVSNAGNLILKPLRREIDIRAMKSHAKHVKIVRARLGENAGIIGASLLV